MQYANAEFIQIHPTAIPGPDKLRLMSESLRGEGGVSGCSATLQDDHHARRTNGTLRRDRASPGTFSKNSTPVTATLCGAISGRAKFYASAKWAWELMDGSASLPRRLAPLRKDSKEGDTVLDIYQKFTGEDPRKVPMKIFPAVHYSMGGAWVDWPAADDPDRWARYRQMTNLPGCFNAGESDYQYHGANRLGANSLLVLHLWRPRRRARNASLREAARSTHETSLLYRFEQELAIEREFSRQPMASEGPENVYNLHDECRILDGAEMSPSSAIIRISKNT